MPAIEDETQIEPLQLQVTVEEVNRVLELGRLLFSVLTPEEVDQLREISNLYRTRMGNTSVT